MENIFNKFKNTLKNLLIIDCSDCKDGCKISCSRRGQCGKFFDYIISNKENNINQK